MKKYEAMELEIVEVNQADIITESDPDCMTKTPEM